MQSLPQGRNRKTPIRLVLIFLVHQFIATIGVLLTALLLTGFAFDVLRWFGRPYTVSYAHWVLTGSPFFPVQISMGLVLGWLVGRRLRNASMFWVWVLPLIFLCYYMIVLPSSTASAARDARFSHFFGWSCRPDNHCMDQAGVTLPFYVASAYSIGALISRKLVVRQK